MLNMFFLKGLFLIVSGSRTSSEQYTVTCSYVISKPMG